MCISVRLGRWHDFGRNAKDGNDDLKKEKKKRKGGGIPLYALHPKLDVIKLIK